MKRGTVVFFAVSAAATCAIQFFFAAHFLKSADTRRFTGIRMVMEKNIMLSSERPASYMGFAKDSGALILALPSCDINLALISGKYDYFTAFPAAGAAVFSMHPSELSSRSRGSMRASGVGFTSSPGQDGLLGFTCVINKKIYSRNFWVPPGLLRLPTDTGAF